MEAYCPILGQPTPVERTPFSRNPWSIVRCSTTGLVFLENPPAYSQLEGEFAWENTFELETQRRDRDQPIVRVLSSVSKRAKRIVFPSRNKIFSLTCALVRSEKQREQARLRILDIGCGNGHLLIDFCDRSVKLGRKVVPLGIEVSRRLSRVAAARCVPRGGQVIRANALAGIGQFSDGETDVVVMSSFLEHECQPLDLLKRVRQVLAPQGIVVLKVPNFACWNRRIMGRRWCGLRFPDHVNYFTPKTLSILVKEAGLVVWRQGFLDKFPLSDNMYAVLKAQASAIPVM
jgi:SAM-dependent methyltransferase